MSTAIYSTESDLPDPDPAPEPTPDPDTAPDTETGTETGTETAKPDDDIRPASFTIDSLCRLLRVAPTAVIVLAERGDVTMTLPPGRRGYCPQLADVRIVRMRRTLTADTTLLAGLRAEHPPEKRDSHLNRMTALGGALRVIDWRAASMADYT